MSNAKKARVKSLRKEIKKTSKYKNLKRLLDDETYSIPFEALKRELRTLHASRTLSKVSVGSANFARQIVKASAIEVSVRSRAVEMKVMAVTVAKELERNLKYFGDWISIEYSEELKVLSTQKERKQFVDRMLERFYKHLDKLHGILEIIEIYITDIDKAGFAAKNIVHTFEVIRKNEGATQL